MKKAKKYQYDYQAQRELRLTLESDADLYRQRIEPIHKNLITKQARGVYKPHLGAKLFQYAVDEEARKYQKNYGFRFTVQDRRAVAKGLERSFRQEANYGNYDNLLPKKYQKKKTIGVFSIFNW